MRAAACTTDPGGGRDALSGSPALEIESGAGGEAACAACRRRAWLFALCATRLDHRARDPDRFWELVSLPDEEFIEAIGGRRRADIRARYERVSERPTEGRAGESGSRAHTVCRHSGAYPARLLRDSALAPSLLHVSDEPCLLRESLQRPTVAIVGSRRASDYGFLTARTLARGLSCSGVTVLGALDEGVANAAHLGALEGDAPSLAVSAAGLSKRPPARCRPAHRRLFARGHLASEVAPQTPARPWSLLAAERTLALLADLVIVVEEELHPRRLACARVAQRIGAALAAVPGRVSSPLSAGCHALILERAALVRDAQDALDVLHGAPISPVRDAQARTRTLEPRLLGIFERVAAGEDTLEALLAPPASRTETLSALAELELGGMLARGLDGRYLARGP
jgi:DNA processing protein